MASGRTFRGHRLSLRRRPARTRVASAALPIPPIAAAPASPATVFSLRSLQNNPGSATTNLNSTGGQTVALTTSNGGAQVFELKDRPWQQQQINYLTQVVEQHKSHWNPQVRADFERNLDLLDQTVNESLQKLSVHPHDDVTEEMLNAALNDKMQLLREFSDL